MRITILRNTCWFVVLLSSSSTTTATTTTATAEDATPQSRSSYLRRSSSTPLQQQQQQRLLKGSSSSTSSSSTGAACRTCEFTGTQPANGVVADTGGATVDSASNNGNAQADITSTRSTTAAAAAVPITTNFAMNDNSDSVEGATGWTFGNTQGNPQGNAQGAAVMEQRKQATGSGGGGKKGGGKKGGGKKGGGKSSSVSGVSSANFASTGGCLTCGSIDTKFGTSTSLSETSSQTPMVVATKEPTKSPTQPPTPSPTVALTPGPTKSPTKTPTSTASPTPGPTEQNAAIPTPRPSDTSTFHPTRNPTTCDDPSQNEYWNLTKYPTFEQYTQCTESSLCASTFGTGSCCLADYCICGNFADDDNKHAECVGLEKESPVPLQALVGGDDPVITRTMSPTTAVPKVPVPTQAPSRSTVVGTEGPTEAATEETPATTTTAPTESSVVVPPSSDACTIPAQNVFWDATLHPDYADKTQCSRSQHCRFVPGTCCMAETCVCEEVATSDRDATCVP